MNKQIGKRAKTMIVPVVILGLLISLLYVNLFQRQAGALKQTNEGTFLEASGMIENNSIVVSSEIPGILKEMYIKEGDMVKKGQEIALVDDSVLQKQYQQAADNVVLAETRVATIEMAIADLKTQNAVQSQQAYNAYMAAKAFYEKVQAGARPQEIEQAEKAVRQAESVYANAEENLKRVEELYRSNAISKQKYDEAATNYNVAKAQLEAAQEKLSLLKEGASVQELEMAKSQMLQAEAAYRLVVTSGKAQLAVKEKELEMAKTQLSQAKTALAQAKEQLEKTLIKSPIDGVINVKSIDKGEMALIGAPIAEILDLNDIRLDVYVAESDIGHVKLHQPAKVYIDSFPDKTYDGEVIEISNKAEFTPKNVQTKKERVNTVFKVTIKILNSRGEVKPGMPADVDIKIN